MELQTLSASQGTTGTVLHVGAGECLDLDAYLSTRAERIVLVEPDPQVAQKLRHITQDEARVKVIEAAVAERGGESTLHRYNVEGLTTLYPLKHLSVRWPGLRQTGQLTVNAFSLPQLLEQISLEEGKAHWLVIDTPGVEATLLRAMIEYLPDQAFSYISLNISSLTPEAEYAWSELRQAMEQAGYRLSDVTNEGNQRRYDIRTDALWKNNQQLKADVDKLKEEKKQLEKEVVDQRAFFESERKKIENVIKKEVGNAIQQVEAYLGIQSFFNSGEYLPRMHGWPVSPDFALYLIDLVNYNDYDLVIEFGSGTSTVLMAKAFVKLSQERKKQGKPSTRQVAFEHLEQYHSQTLQFLQQAQVAENVQLELAPLAPYTVPDGTTYSYYTCHAALESLVKKMNIDSPVRILVVVDGPPALTGKWARYPALPSMLSVLPTSFVDILLDDYGRKEEKEIADQWEKDLKLKGVEPKVVVKSMEKDAVLISFPWEG